MPQHAEVRQVRQEIDRHHNHDAKHERARKIAFRIHDLLRDEVRLLPSAVREQNRDEGSNYGSKVLRRAGAADGGDGPPATRPTPMSVASAKSFRLVKMFCVIAAGRTPTELIPERKTIAATARGTDRRCGNSRSARV